MQINKMDDKDYEFEDIRSWKLYTSSEYGEQRLLVLELGYHFLNLCCCHCLVISKWTLSKLENGKHNWEYIWVYETDPLFEKLVSMALVHHFGISLVSYRLLVYHFIYNCYIVCTGAVFENTSIYKFFHTQKIM